jgi:glucose repression regulatory protein TUP1
VGNALAELDLERLPAHQKKVDADWFAIFNPEVPRVLDVDLLHTLQHESVVCCVRFSHDGKYVATGCNRSAQIFDVVTGSKICILQDETVDSVGDLYIRSVCFSPDGRYLATGAEDKLIRVWDIASRTIRNTFAGHEQDIYSLDFARDGRTIASGSGDRTVRLWDIEAGQNVLTLSIEDGVTTVAISPDTKYVAAGSLDKSVRVWDATTGYLVERLEGPDGHKDSVYSVGFAPNGKDLVSGSLDKTIKMWELAAPRGQHPNNAPKGGRCIKTFEGHKVRANLKEWLQSSLTNRARTLSYQLLLHLTELGSSQVPKIVVFNSGTPELATPNSCYKVTRIPSLAWHPVQAVGASQLVAVT